VGVARGDGLLAGTTLGAVGIASRLLLEVEHRRADAAPDRDGRRAR
jgi:hypothetical protein